MTKEKSTLLASLRSTRKVLSLHVKLAEMISLDTAQLRTALAAIDEFLKENEQ